MANKAKGAKFYYGETGAVYTSTSGWTAVANVMDYELPESELADIKTTNHDTSGNAHTYISGIEESGDSSVTTHYDATARTALGAIKGLAKKFKVVFASGSGVGWEGYVRGNPTTGIDLEGLENMTVRTKVSGEITNFASVS